MDTGMVEPQRRPAVAVAVAVAFVTAVAERRLGTWTGLRGWGWKKWLPRQPQCWYEPGRRGTSSAV